MLLMVTVNDKGQSEDLLVNDEGEVRSYYHKQEVTIYKQNQLYILWLYIIFHHDSNLGLLFPSSITPIHSLLHPSAMMKNTPYQCLSEWWAD